VQDPQDDAGGKGASFLKRESGWVPDALQQIAHNPGNKLSSKRQAGLTDGGAWKLVRIN